jgi:osmoprotectant transport system ATP-binding protein
VAKRTEEHRKKASEIRFESVTKVYRHAAHPAVDDVSITIEPGKLTVLLGPSGCGKTTLLKLANRLLEPTAGRVLMDNRDLRDIPGHLLRRHIGYVIQHAGLFPHMKVEENIAVVPRLIDWDAAAISRRVDELMDLVGLPPGQYRGRYPSQLSGGERQRVGLARAVAAGPSTLLMDEPFGALDAITRARLQDELLTIHRRLGQTVLFVTHDVDEAMQLADRIAVMRAGSIVQFDKPSVVVLSPADSFVADLIGSRDVMRRLGLMQVTAALRPLEGQVNAEKLPWVNWTENLRTALALLLEGGNPTIGVRDSDGSLLGTVNLEQIQDLVSAQVSTRDAASGGPR